MARIMLDERKLAGLWGPCPRARSGRPSSTFSDVSRPTARTRRLRREHAPPWARSPPPPAAVAIRHRRARVRRGVMLGAEAALPQLHSGSITATLWTALATSLRPERGAGSSDAIARAEASCCPRGSTSTRLVRRRRRSRARALASCPASRKSTECGGRGAGGAAGYGPPCELVPRGSRRRVPQRREAMPRRRSPSAIRPRSPARRTR